MKMMILKLMLFSLITMASHSAQKFCEHENLKCNKDKHCCMGLICHEGKCK